MRDGEGESGRRDGSPGRIPGEMGRLMERWVGLEQVKKVEFLGTATVRKDSVWRLESTFVASVAAFPLQFSHKIQGLMETQLRSQRGVKLDSPPGALPRPRTGAAYSFADVDARLGDGFAGFAVEALGQRRRSVAALPGLERQLVGHLEGLAQGQDDFIGQVLTRGREEEF